MAGGACLFAADGPVSFTRDIQPVFESSCWKCHGGAVQLSKLDLRTRESALKGGARGPAIVPGKPAESRVYRVIAGLEKPSMPLDGKLTAEQIETIRRWIDQGATWDAVETASAKAAPLPGTDEMPISAEARSYWAFQRPVRAAVPIVQREFTNPIDRFLEKARVEKGIK